MKLKSFIGACIACTAIAVMAVSVHAEKYAIGGTDGTVDGTDHTGNTVEVPVMVIPDQDETAKVNGYIMTFTYDPNKAKPHSNGDADSPYATMGENFNEGIIVSGTTTAANGQQTLIIAWASAEPVTVASGATVDQETMAKVTFDIVDETVTDIPVEVKLTQLATDDTTVKNEDEVKEQVVHEGDINLADFIYGDITGDGVVDTDDWSALTLHTLKVNIYDVFPKANLEAANVSGDIDGIIDTDDWSALTLFTLKADVSGLFPNTPLNSNQ